LPLVTVVVPTLAADEALSACLESLAGQRFRDFEVVVVDNSGRGAVRQSAGVSMLAPERNIGFGAAINLAARQSGAKFIATLNDDAVASPEWLEALVQTARTNPCAGMFASQVRLSETELDSAGMLLCADGSSKQRGHGRAPARFSEEALFPSGSAALYRRELFAELGGFDDDYFLYCEDTDLGLRALWAGWRCAYVASAVVYHRYSHSAGRVSPLKAYLVERNRLFTAVKNLPGRMLWKVLPWSAARYFWHVWSVFRGQGAAGQFNQEGGSVLTLVWFVLKAHGALAVSLPRLLRQRRSTRTLARITAAEFEEMAARHSISVREVASL